MEPYTHFVHITSEAYDTKARLSIWDHTIATYWYGPYNTVDSNKLEYGPRTINAGAPSFLGFGVGDGHIPTLWLLLQAPTIPLFGFHTFGSGLGSYSHKIGYP